MKKNSDLTYNEVYSKGAERLWSAPQTNPRILMGLAITREIFKVNLQEMVQILAIWQRNLESRA